MLDQRDHVATFVALATVPNLFFDIDREAIHAAANRHAPKRSTFPVNLIPRSLITRSMGTAFAALMISLSIYAASTITATPCVLAT
jgi:hypothetical protein